MAFVENYDLYNCALTPDFWQIDGSNNYVLTSLYLWVYIRDVLLLYFKNMNDYMNSPEQDANVKAALVPVLKWMGIIIVVLAALAFAPVPVLIIGCLTLAAKYLLGVAKQ